MTLTSTSPPLASVVLTTLLLLAMVGCGQSEEFPAETADAPQASAAEGEAQPATTVAAAVEPGEEGDATMAESLNLRSSAFDPGQAIPSQYTCDGVDISPALSWGDPPAGTESLALIMDDPDAEPVAGFVWVHWILFNIPADSRSMPEHIPAESELADGSRHGETSFGRLGYGGPCPPSGTHEYVFQLYALDTVLELEPGAEKASLLQAMDGHILAQTELTGTYAR